jgi:hypothetical protein
MRLLLIVIALMGASLLWLGRDVPAGPTANMIAVAFCVMFGGSLLLLTWVELKKALIERAEQRRHRRRHDV